MDKWPYECKCGAIPYKSMTGKWVCPNGCKATTIKRLLTQRELILDSGTEGPRNDPYGYDEYTVLLNNRWSITFHLGLAEYLTASEKKDGKYQEFFRVDANGDQFKVACAIWEAVTGIRPSIFLRYYYRIKSICKECKRRVKNNEVMVAAGFPGETLFIHRPCGSVFDTEMNYSAII